MKTELRQISQHHSKEEENSKLKSESFSLMSYDYYTNCSSRKKYEKLEKYSGDKYRLPVTLFSFSNSEGSAIPTFLRKKNILEFLAKRNIIQTLKRTLCV